MDTLGPLVATAGAATFRETAEAARAARRAGAARVEVRLDLLRSEEERLGAMGLATEMPLLVSGHRDRLRPWEIAHLRRARSLGAWVDVPAEEASAPFLDTLDPSRLVLSWHGRAADLGAVLARMRGRPAACYKLVPEARGYDDVEGVRRLLALHGGRGDLCAFASGPHGVPSRVLALAWGSAATYAVAPGASAAAPGQMPLEFLLSCTPEEVSRDTPLFALCGWPLAFTKTPFFFNRWLRTAGRQERYVPVPVETLDAFWESASALPLAGVAVTIPHKRAVLSRLGRLSRLASAAGAVNTLLRSGGGWTGANTDVYGVRSALSVLPRRGLRSLILGAGGAAAAAAVALRARGPVALCARDRVRAEELSVRLGCGTVAWTDREGASWDLLVNATPLGRDGLSSPLPLDSLRGGAVLDMVVLPKGETPLLARARERRLTVVPGEAMLRAQARLQFRLWTRTRPPAD